MKETTHCPHCGSARVHRSHRRGAFEHLLSALGATIRRCHDCRRRYAWMGRHTLPLGDSDFATSAWSGVAAMSGGLAACVLIVWWMVTRFGELRG